MQKLINVDGEDRNLFNLYKDEVFELILAGKITDQDFEDWVDNERDDSRRDGYDYGYQNGYDAGYDSGYDNGYESAQENYGDGPSQ